VSETGNASVYSTDDVHPRDRVSYWVEVATKEFYKHGFRARADFLGELCSGIVGRLWVGRCKCDPCDIVREPPDIARDDIDDILLSVRISGKTLVAQGDREAVQGTGTMTLLDARRPSKISIPIANGFNCRQGTARAACCPPRRLGGVDRAPDIDRWTDFRYRRRFPIDACRTRRDLG